MCLSRTMIALTAALVTAAAVALPAAPTASALLAPNAMSVTSAVGTAAARRPAPKAASTPVAHHRSPAARPAPGRFLAARSSTRPVKARTVAWRDDFSGRAGARPNPRYWTPQVGGGGWGNGEVQYYTDDPANASLDGRGRLAITARPDDGAHTCWYGPCRFTSARLTTHRKVTASSGRIEARMKLPAGVGLWPAFWLMGDDIDEVSWPKCGELDIMEWVGDAPGEIWSSVHGPGYVRAGLTGASRLPAPASFADAFHTFAMEWTPTGLAFSVDGVVHQRVDRASIGARNLWVFDDPMYAILNLAVGGAWPGDPTPATRFPATLLVDSVTIYR